MVVWLKNNWLIALILVIAFLLRFIPLFEYEFFYDELSALDRIQYNSFTDLIDKGVKELDVHPAFIQLFLFAWAKIGGTSEVWIKLPFLICGLISCWLIFLFTNKWFSYKTAVISAIVVSCSMIFLVYSSSNHLYATAVLFSLSATYYLFEIVFGKSPQLKHYILFGLFILLGALNHHMGALYGLIIGLLGVVFADKKQKLFLVYTAVGIMLFYLPHLPLTLFQSGKSIAAGEDGWLTPPKWYACFKFLKTLFGTGLVIYLFIFLFAYWGVKNKFSFLVDKKIAFLFIAYTTYCLIVHFYSILKTPLLQFSVLLIASHCIIIIVAKGLSFIPNKLFNITCIALITAFLVQTIFVKQYYSLGIKQSHKSAVKQTIEAKTKYGATNVTAIYATETFFVTRYMDEFKQQRFKCLTAFDSVFNNPTLLTRYLKSLTENYIVLSDPDPVLVERVKIYFPYLIYHDEGYFKNIFLLSKKSDNSVKDKTVINSNTLHHSEGFIFPEKFETENNCILIDSTNEFPFYVWANFNSLLVQEGRSVVCTSTFKPYSKMDNLSFDFNIKKNDSSLFYSSRNFRDFYLPEDTLQHGFSSVFIGTDFYEWKNTKLECYFWNSGKKRYLVKDISLKIIDVNPHKYTLWD
jgi:4-amino-4-deoxy-L-arabinose transferase-like glycosyltransferase